ncbi:MAG: hypothetical protein H7222_18450 [Methylotenera sp.]|nr:hypothetical protein [Oligoflexia bacterium]
MQNSQNPALVRQGVRKVFVSPLVNNSYKPGVENLLYNELVRSLASNRRVSVVQRPEEADAVLGGTIRSATYGITAGTSSNSIYPTNRPTIEITVATEYQAILACDFKLTRTHALELSASAAGAPVASARETSRFPVKTAAGSVLWNAAFSRVKRFPGNNQKDEFGTTSPLINESEFDRALRDIASGMMGDVNESMLAMF